MKYSVFFALVFCFLAKVNVLPKDFDTNPAFLRPSLFYAIKVPNNLNPNQLSHINGLLELCSTKLANQKIKCPVKEKNYLLSISKCLSIKPNELNFCILEKIIFILLEDLRQISCPGQNCKACFENFTFLSENAFLINDLINKTTKKRRLRWFKKKNLVLMFLATTPPFTWILRHKLSEMLFIPLTKFIKFNLPFVLPLLASLLSLFTFKKFYPKGPSNNDNDDPPQPPSNNNFNFINQDSNFDKIKHSLSFLGQEIAQTKADLDSFSTNFDQAMDNNEARVRELKFKIEQERLKKLLETPKKRQKKNSPSPKNLTSIVLFDSEDEDKVESHGQATTSGSKDFPFYRLFSGVDNKPLSGPVTFGGTPVMFPR